jgi:hypothetical protein
VFSGMISMQYCAKQDVKRLIEKLEKWVTMHQPALTRTQASRVQNMSARSIAR